MIHPQKAQSADTIFAWQENSRGRAYGALLFSLGGLTNVWQVVYQKK
jgi:hypothetical protein